MIAAEFDIAPDELLYSAWARYGDRLRLPSATALRRHLFGSHLVVAVPDLPGRIGDFLARLAPGHGYTTTGLIRGHTTLPYFSHFKRPDLVAAAGRAMGESGPGRPGWLLGTQQTSVPRVDGLRFCPACAAEDQLSLGEACWRRSHQPPGVLVCAWHGLALFRTAAAAIRPGAVRLEYVALTRAVIASGTPEYVDAGKLPELLGIAEGTRWLLSQWTEQPNFAGTALRYRALAAEAGFGAGRGIRFGQLRDEVVARYGEEFLARVGCTLPPLPRWGTTTWLHMLCSSSYVASTHPLHHLLFLGTLGVSPGLVLGSAARAAYPEVPMRTGKFTPTSEWDAEFARLLSDSTVTRAAVARKLAVSWNAVRYHALRLGISRAGWKTADSDRERLAAALSNTEKAKDRQAAFRKSWLQLRDANAGASRHELQTLDRPAYDWLNIHDREWLEANLPPRRRPPHGRERRAWGARDAHFLGLGRDAVPAFYATPEPVRLTTQRLLDAMGTRLSDRLRAKLPLTAAFVAANVESSESFALRRLLWSLKRLTEEGAPLTPGRLLRRVGLFPPRSDFRYAMAERLIREWEAGHRDSALPQHATIPLT